MDISSISNIAALTLSQPGAVSGNTSLAGIALDQKDKASGTMFDSFLNAAVENINETNHYLSDMENEEIKLAMGETESTHDLTIALQKASTALQYTVAVRDKFLEAYKEIMQMQI